MISREKLIMVHKQLMLSHPSIFAWSEFLSNFLHWKLRLETFQFPLQKFHEGKDANSTLKSMSKYRNGFQDFSLPRQDFAGMVSKSPSENVSSLV